MKTMLRRRLGVILIIGLLCSLLLSYVLQIKLLQKDADDASLWLFWQVQQILDENKIETGIVKEEFRADCLLKANAAAYMIEHASVDLNDQAEMKHIADLLQVDEFHLFNTEGTIYAGSEPKYFGYNFHSGEQMQFFLPMLEDKSLELCQEVTPNTAEGKLMQYAAVWREDGQGIVQIGMEPSRIIKAMEKNELSYIFSLLTERDGADLCAADPNTFEILGSTDTDYVGRTLFDLGFTAENLSSLGHSFHTNVNGVPSYCMFTYMDGVLVGRFCATESLYPAMSGNLLIMSLCLLTIFSIMLLSIFRYLDKRIIRGIDTVNAKLKKIADGDLTEGVDVHTTPEFTQLSGHINHMVSSLLDNATKLTFVLNAMQLPIGIYEYSRNENDRVHFTSKLPKIMGISKENVTDFFSSREDFEQKLAELQSDPVGENIFRLTAPEERYLRIESYTRADRAFGVLSDITGSVTEKKRIEHERDEDLLTGLHNGRAFYAQMDALFQQTDALQKAALIMIDTDELKQVNDRFGHQAGDRYLCGMASILRSCTAPKRVTARLSGDEFALFIYGCETEEELRRYVTETRRKQRGVETEFQGRLLPIKFSMGTAVYPGESSDYRTLLRLADQRMYEDKRQRKSMHQ